MSLAEDARAAQMAGMSYGKYVALNGTSAARKRKAGIEVMPVNAVVKRTCPHCGMEFIPGRVNQIYCGYDCKTIEDNKRRLKRMREARRNENSTEGR